MHRIHPRLNRGFFESLNEKIRPFIIIYLIVIILYYPVLTTYFSHDDFFHFTIAKTDGSLRGIFYLIGFHPFSERGIAFYRPLFRDLLYHFSYDIFGLNQYPLRIFSFLIHFVNIYLTFGLLQKLFNKRVLSLFAAFFFAITAANVSSFYYLAGGIQTQGVTMFILITLLLFKKYLENNRLEQLLLSYFAFLLALISHEQSIVLFPLMILLVVLDVNRKIIKKRLFVLIPIFITLILYLYLNYYVIGYSSGENQYQMTFNIKTTVQTIAWYVVWAIGLPETFIDYLLPGLGLNPSLMRYWGNYYKIIFPTFFLSVFFVLIAILIVFLKKRSQIFNRVALFLFLWFIMGLLPVLLLPAHKSTHYLYPSLPAFWGLVAFFCYNAHHIIMDNSKKWAYVYILLLTASLILLSSASAILGKNTYWAAKRGKLAGKLIREVKMKYPTLPKGSIVYFTNDPSYPYVSESWGSTSKQAMYALNNEDAMRLLYHDPEMRVFYEDVGVPIEFSKTSLFLIQAQN